MSLKDKIINLRSSIKPFFKQIPARFTDSSRKTRIVSASAVVLTLIAFGAAGVAPLPTDPDEVSVRAISAELELPSLSEQIAKLEAQQQLYVAEDKMRAGDTLAALLTRLGVDDDEASNFIKSDSRARAMLRLKAGTSVQAQTSNDGVLQMLRATIANDGEDTPTNLLIQRDGDKFPVTKGIELSRDDLVRRELIGELMCHGEVNMQQFGDRHGFVFDEYFAQDLRGLQPLVDDGLVSLCAQTIRVTPRGRPMLRNIAMCFDAYLGKGASTPRYSRTI